MKPHQDTLVSAVSSFESRDVIILFPFSKFRGFNVKSLTFESEITTPPPCFHSRCRLGGAAVLHSRDRAGVQDHRGAGGLGSLVALAGFSAVCLHAGLRGRRHQPAVGRLGCTLLQKV